MRKNEGMTLLELLVASSIMTVVFGMLYMVFAALNTARAAQDARTDTQDQARSAMQAIVRELRQAQAGSINPAALPAATISYRIATDVNGNGTAVDNGGFIETTPVHTLGRDTNDLNADGRTTRQLILNTGARIIVLANDLAPTTAAAPTAGIWFQASGSGIQVTVQIRKQPTPRSAFVTSTLQETVIPRN